MYHEVSHRQRRQRRIMAAAGACAVALAFAACAAGFGAAQASTRVQGAQALREAVLTSAKQCCAVEGSYPSSIEYLEQRYGLVINHDDYDVAYDWFAGNVMPSVAVTPK